MTDDEFIASCNERTRRERLVMLTIKAISREVPEIGKIPIKFSGDKATHFRWIGDNQRQIIFGHKLLDYFYERGFIDCYETLYGLYRQEGYYGKTGDMALVAITLHEVAHALCLIRKQYDAHHNWQYAIAFQDVCNIYKRQAV